MLLVAFKQLPSVGPISTIKIFNHAPSWLNAPLHRTHCALVCLTITHLPRCCKCFPSSQHHTALIAHPILWMPSKVSRQETPNSVGEWGIMSHNVDDDDDADDDADDDDADDDADDDDDSVAGDDVEDGELQEDDVDDDAVEDDDVDVAEDEVEVDDVEDDEEDDDVADDDGPIPSLGSTLCASLRSRNALGPFTRATLRENSQVKCHRPRPRTTLCASLRSQHALGRFTKAILRENLQGKCWGPRWRGRLCASLRSRNALGHLTRATLCENLQVKCRGPKCASLRSRNSRQHCTRAIWYEHLQVKCRWSSTGLCSYCKNSSVWTRCFGKKGSFSRVARFQTQNMQPIQPILLVKNQVYHL